MRWPAALLNATSDAPRLRMPPAHAWISTPQLPETWKRDHLFAPFWRTLAVAHTSWHVNSAGRVAIATRFGEWFSVGTFGTALALVCRLLAIAASQLVRFRSHLCDAPRSLMRLSTDHPHGWGMAHAKGPGRWAVRRSAMAAFEDGEFESTACGTRGRILVAHVRQRTIGAVTVANTHPFKNGAWIFAHNGTISDVSFLYRNSSAVRLAQVVGDTDSELLFAFLLTRLDGGMPQDRALLRAVTELSATRGVGTCNFVLSDGSQRLRPSPWAFSVHVRGRSRLNHEEPNRDPDGHRRTVARAAIAASEPTNNDSWHEVPDGRLLRASSSAMPRWETVV